MGSDGPVWVGFIPFKDDAPVDIRGDSTGFQISSADTRAQLEAIRAYQDKCKNTTPIVLPTEYEECLTAAELIEAEKTLASITIQQPTITKQEPAQKKRKGPVPPLSLAKAQLKKNS